MDFTTRHTEEHTRLSSQYTEDEVEHDLSLQWADFKLYSIRSLISDAFDMLRFKKFLRVGSSKYHWIETISYGDRSQVELCKLPTSDHLWAIKRYWVESDFDLALAAKAYNTLEGNDHPLLMSATDGALCFSPSIRRRAQTEVRIVMPFIDGDLLESELQARRKNRDFMQLGRILRMMRQICDALLDLHRSSTPTVHMNLTPANIIVSGNEDWPIIVDTDAAFSSNVDCSDAEERKNLEFLSQKILDPMYRAPELHKITPDSFIDERVDIWNLGCVLYYMAYLKPPFEPNYTMTGKLETHDEISARINRGGYDLPPTHFPEALLDLIETMLRTNPRLRPTTEAVTEILDTMILEHGADMVVQVKYPWINPILSGVEERSSETSRPTSETISSDPRLLKNDWKRNSIAQAHEFAAAVEENNNEPITEEGKKMELGDSIVTESNKQRESKEKRESTDSELRLRRGFGRLKSIPTDESPSKDNFRPPGQGFAKQHATPASDQKKGDYYRQVANLQRRVTEKKTPDYMGGLVQDHRNTAEFGALDFQKVKPQPKSRPLKTIESSPRMNLEEVLTASIRAKREEGQTNSETKTAEKESAAEPQTNASQPDNTVTDKTEKPVETPPENNKSLRNSKKESKKDSKRKSKKK